MFPLRLRAFFVFIGLLAVVDKWLEKYGYNRRQDIQQGNTSQNAAPRNSISGMSSLLSSLCIRTYSQKSELMFFSCFGLNSCNIFAISSSVSMHRVVTITNLNVYRQHLSSIYKNINHFSTISSRCKGDKIDQYKMFILT